MNELQVKEQNAIANAEDVSAWGDGPLNVKNIVIPRLFLMQPNSEPVTEGNAAFGDFRCSLTNKKIGDMKSVFDVIPFYLQEIFVEYEVVPGKKPGEVEKKYLRHYPVTPMNRELPYEDTEKEEQTGREMKISRDYTMNYFVLLPDEVKAGGELPYILTFRRFGVKEGKKLYTQMYVTNKGRGLPPPGFVVKIAVKKETNEKGTWAIPQVILDPDQVSLASKVLSPVTGTRTSKDNKEETYTMNAIHRCLEWMKTIKSGEAKMDTDSFEKEVRAETTTVTQSAPAKDSGESIENGPERF